MDPLSQAREGPTIETGPLLGCAFDCLGEAFRIAQGVAKLLDVMEEISFGPVPVTDVVERSLNRRRRFLIPAEETGQMFDLPLAGAASRDAAGLVKALAQLIGQGYAFAQGCIRLNHTHRKRLDGLSRPFLCRATAALALVVRILDHDSLPTPRSF